MQQYGIGLEQAQRALTVSRAVDVMCQQRKWTVKQTVEHLIERLGKAPVLEHGRAMVEESVEQKVARMPPSLPPPAMRRSLLCNKPATSSSKSTSASSGHRMRPLPKAANDDSARRQRTNSVTEEAVNAKLADNSSTETSASTSTNVVTRSATKRTRNFGEEATENKRARHMY